MEAEEGSEVIERGSVPAVVTVIVALAAMAVALVAVLKQPEEKSESGDLDMAALEERIQELERKESERKILAELKPMTRELKPTRPEPAPAQPGDLEARIAALEKKLAEQRARGGPPVSLTDILKKRAGQKDDGKTVADLQADAMDRAAAGYMRLQALRRLRFLPNGRSREVVLSMLELYRESDDPKVRADVFRQLSKVDMPELRDAAIEALENDKSVKVREEAAETLGPFRKDPAARDALERAAENDADAGVQDEAKKALAGRR